jgi:hypothetical protein
MMSEETKIAIIPIVSADEDYLFHQTVSQSCPLEELEPLLFPKLFSLLKDYSKLKMTLFQDKKLIMHISLEIVVLGSMGYFFYNRTNKLNHRIEQMSQLISALQNDTKDLREQIQNIQKQQTTKIASLPVLLPVETDKDYKLFKMFRERELKEQKIRVTSLTSILFSPIILLYLDNSSLYDRIFSATSSEIQCPVLVSQIG